MFFHLFLFVKIQVHQEQNLSFHMQAMWQDVLLGGTNLSAHAHLPVHNYKPV